MDLELPEFSLEAVTIVLAIQTVYVGWRYWRGCAAYPTRSRAVKEAIKKTLRVQLDKRTIVFSPIFLAILWTSGLLYSRELAPILAIGYILGRPLCSCGTQTIKIWHFLGYYMMMTSVILLSLSACLGLLRAILEPYSDTLSQYAVIDLGHLISGLYPPPTPPSSFF